MNRTYSHQSPSVLDVRDPYSEFYQGPHHGKHWYLWHPEDIGTARPMNEVQWFKAFQPLLLRVVNTGYGRQLMGIDSELPLIDLITKNAIRYYLGNGQWQSQFHVGAKWANVIRYRWPEFKRYARFFYDMPNFFTLLNIDGRAVPAHATTTVYPDPNPESTSVDGHLYLYSGASWDEHRAASDADAANDTYDKIPLQISSSSDLDRMGRSWMLFDTSSISASDVVSAAVLYVTGSDSSWGYQQYHYITISGGSPASNTALVAADWSAMTALDSPTEYQSGNVPPTTHTNHRWQYARYWLEDSVAYNENFPLVPTTAITKNGITKFIFRDSYDVDDDDGNSGGDNCYALSADTAGTSKDPKLVVTHAAFVSNVETINGIDLADIETFNGITAANAETINTLDF